MPRPERAQCFIVIAARVARAEAALHGRLDRLQALQSLRAIAPGHAHVEQDNRDLPAMPRVKAQRLVTTGRHPDLETFRLQERLQHPAHSDLVINHQDSGRVSCCCSDQVLASVSDRDPLTARRRRVRSVLPGRCRSSERECARPAYAKRRVFAGAIWPADRATEPSFCLRRRCPGAGPPGA